MKNKICKSEYPLLNIPPKKITHKIVASQMNLPVNCYPMCAFWC